MRIKAKIKMVLEAKKDLTDVYKRALREARRLWVEDIRRDENLKEEIFYLRSKIETRMYVENEIKGLLK